MISEDKLQRFCASASIDLKRDPDLYPDRHSRPDVQQDKPPRPER